MTEFISLYDGLSLNAPGDTIPQNETVVEEELIDNQETETPAAYEPLTKPPVSNS